MHTGTPPGTGLLMMELERESGAGDVTQDALWTRNQYKDYFNGEGEVPWQRRVAGVD